MMGMLEIFWCIVLGCLFIVMIFQLVFAINEVEQAIRSFKVVINTNEYNVFDENDNTNLITLGTCDRCAKDEMKKLYWVKGKGYICKDCMTDNLIEGECNER